MFISLVSYKKERRLRMIHFCDYNNCEITWIMLMVALFLLAAEDSSSANSDIRQAE